jgi:eukaryotic-like serine/threonine-protein kinase
VSETISPNSTIAQYTIVSKIGEGGMGEVWRARDAKLGRDVAIKVLPSALSTDKDRLARFEQEAQAAGALNHPNILVIYHIGAHNGAPYIVSELLEGESLRDRMGGNSLPQRKAVDYALQLARGLAAAHEKGIVHRDIKPDNIFITEDGRVKILDFGIAKLTGPTDGNHSQTEVPTRKVNTDPGTVMGTVGYMSPEQLKGQPVDHRSDIFSFGAILYEMLAGKRAFRGDSIAETVSAILREDPPDLSETNKTVSPALERVVRHCLEKNPAERFHSARDLAFAIENLSGSAINSGQTVTMPSVTSEIDKSESKRISRWFGNAKLAWIVGAVLLFGLLATWAVLYVNRSSSDTRAIRLSFNPPPELAFNDTQQDAAVISPDGQKIAFTAISADHERTLYVRNLDSSEVKLLPGSENALEPFWSPDSRSIAYGSNGKLKRSDLTGANAQVLCDVGRLIGGTWSKEGVIVFAPDYSRPLLQVSARGGEPKVVEMQGEHSNADHRSPYFLPDGRHFLFSWRRGIWAGSLDSADIKEIVEARSAAVYAPPGWLISLQNDTLVAQAFDAEKLALTGEPIPIIPGAKNAPNSRRFSVSDNGVLVWQGLWQRDYQLVWYDRSGKQTGEIDAPMKVSVGQSPMLSPDGQRLVVRRTLSPVGVDSNIWVVDLDKRNGQRITSTFSQLPVWSPDGSRIAYNNGANIVVKAANGSGEPETLLPRTTFPAAWSPDGRFILFMERSANTRMDLWALPMFGDKREHLLSNSPFNEQNPQLSPDGRWLAYTSDETGDYEVYVQSFSADGKLGADKKRVSTAGGRLPVWRRDGSELFFVAADGHMMASSVKIGGTEFEFAAPKPLFKTRTLSLEGGIYHEYDVSPDGQRFLIGTLIGDADAPPPTVIMNWPALLKK